MPQAVLPQAPLSIRGHWECALENLGSPQCVTWVQPENLYVGGNPGGGAVSKINPKTVQVPRGLVECG